MASGHYSDCYDPVPCPYCKTDCYAEFVDVSVGMVQVSPYYCEACGAYEIGPYYKPKLRSKIEDDTGWYEPTKE